MGHCKPIKARLHQYINNTTTTTSNNTEMYYWTTIILKIPQNKNFAHTFPTSHIGLRINILEALVWRCSVPKNTAHTVAPCKSQGIYALLIILKKFI